MNNNGNGQEKLNNAASPARPPVQNANNDSAPTEVFLQQWTNYHISKTPLAPVCPGAPLTQSQSLLPAGGTTQPQVEEDFDEWARNLQAKLGQKKS